MSVEFENPENLPVGKGVSISPIRGFYYTGKCPNCGSTDSAQETLSHFESYPFTCWKCKTEYIADFREGANDE